MKTLFKECMASVDDYLTKKALGQIDDDLSFFCEDGEFSWISIYNQWPKVFHHL